MSVGIPPAGDSRSSVVRFAQGDASLAPPVWAKILAAMFIVFLAATAVFDVSLAPRSSTSDADIVDPSQPGEEILGFEKVLHESATGEVGSMLSTTVDGGLERLDDLRLEFRELGSRIGDAVGF